MEQRFRAQFVNSLSGFKSACLVGTQNSNGQTNLSIISSIFHVGANPPLLGMIIRPHSVRRDTLENIQQTGVYTFNQVNSRIIAQAHQTSARYDESESEFDKIMEHGYQVSKKDRIEFGLDYRLGEFIKNNTQNDLWFRTTWYISLN